ncbi:HNH endonuclease [Oricola sp.]|uniref:HNH endonuclease n=1 Tax=Oricola sp. TaxID=1979950 RepID=UPI003516EF9E
MTPETPQSYVVSTELRKAAFDNGWRLEAGEQDGWLMRKSHNAPGTIGLAAAGPNGPWFLAVDHGGVAVELGDGRIDLEGPGFARFGYHTTAELHRAVSRAYDLAVALPDDPLRRFESETRILPRTTEAERLVIQRVGQDLFRDALMRFWDGRCPLTGIQEPELLRASHMKPWAECASDAERLDVYNGLLLSALWDAAFDRYLVTFTEDGRPEFSTRLSPATRGRLEEHAFAPLQLSSGHQPYLAFHRAAFFRKGSAAV